MVNDNKKYIQKIKLPISGTTEDLFVKDAEALDGLNGYSKAQIISATTPIYFANLAITEIEIDDLFPKTNEEEDK